MKPPILAPVHREGWVFVALFSFITVLFALVSDVLGFMGLVLTIWCLYFFRNPTRTTPIRDGLVISAADGMVQSIIESPLPPELQSADKASEIYWRVSVFLSVFDVHINRIPIDGTIVKSHYHGGKFFNASLDKASEHNERQSLLIESTHGARSIGLVQIAGLIARRIRCDVAAGQNVQTGFRYGLIRFGSRVDVYLPHDIVPLVIVGQRVVGGETILADLTSTEERRIGDNR